MCGGLLLLGVPTCLRACEGGTPGRRRVGIRSSELGFAYHTSTLCMLCRKGWKSSQKLFPLETEQGSSYWLSQGVAPFFCPGGASVDRWLGSFQFRPPCWECVGKPREEKRKLFDCEKGHSVLGGGVLAPAWSLHQESRTILGAWRGAIAASSESDQIRPQRQSDLLWVIPTCSFQSIPCASIPIGIWLSDPIIKSGAEERESGLSWCKRWELPFPTLGKVDQRQRHGKGKPKWKLTDSLGARILVLTWDSAVNNADSLFYTQPSLLPSSSNGAGGPPVFPSSTSKCTGSLLRPAWPNWTWKAG